MNLSSKIQKLVVPFLVLTGTPYAVNSFGVKPNPSSSAAVTFAQQQQSQTPSSTSSTCLASSSSSSSSETTTSATPNMSMKWFQHELSITAPSRGCHLITGDVLKVISKDLSQIKIGMCNLFVQHTSASLTINENADPDVRRYDFYYSFYFLICTNNKYSIQHWA